MNFLGQVAMGTLRAYSYVAPTERGGYRLARAARRFVKPWQGPFTAPGPITLTLDLSTYPDCCMACGLFELDTLRVLRRLLRPGMHLVDCGANIGYFTFLGARYVGPTGRVDAIEPDPLNRSRLQEHMQVNGALPQIRIHGVAASDANGTATLYHPEGHRNHSMASLIAEFIGPDNQTFTVPTVRLDELLDRPPDVVKMDIEGAELAALRGMTRLLVAERPPKLIMEHNPASSRAAGHRCGDLLRELQRVNPRYRAWWIGWRLSEMTLDEIDVMPRQGNILYQAI